jgi:hypothetical protein
MGMRRDMPVVMMMSVGSMFHGIKLVIPACTGLINQTRTGGVNQTRTGGVNQTRTGGVNQTRTGSGNLRPI